MGSFKELSFNFNFLHKNKKLNNDDSTSYKSNNSSKSSALHQSNVVVSNNKNELDMHNNHHGQFLAPTQTTRRDNSQPMPPELFTNPYNMSRKTNSVVSITTNTSDTMTTGGSIRDFSNFNNIRNNNRDNNNRNSGQEQSITKKPSSFNSSSSAMSTSATSSPLSEISRRMRASNQFSDSHSKSSSTSRTTNNGVSNSDSDSDSDWDDDDNDPASKKINIKIKPLSQVTPSKLSASVDELRATVEAWKPLGNLNPLANKLTNRKHHKSTHLPLHLSQYNLNQNNVHNGPTLFNNSNNLRRSSVALRENEHLSILKPSQTHQTQSPATVNSDRYADLNELFSNVTTLKKESIPIDANLMLNTLHSNSSNKYPLALTKSVSNDQNHQQFDNDPFGFNQSTVNNRPRVRHVSDSFPMERTIINPEKNPVIIAVATQESINATFRGNETECVVRLLGYVKIAVPANLTKVPPGTDMSPLCFRLQNTIKLKKIYCNQELIKKGNQPRTVSFEEPYEMDMPSFSRYILDLNRQKPQAKYYNIEVLRYTLKQENLQSDSSPIQMISHWECDPNTTKLRIDLKYSDLYKTSGLTISDIKNLRFSLHVDGGVTSFQTKPQGHWDVATSELSWSFRDMLQAVDPTTSIGSLLARFDLLSGPTNPSLVNVQFAIPTKSLSGLQLKLAGSGYRISLSKSEVRTGRFVCEPSVAT